MENEIYQAVIKLKNYCKGRKCELCDLYSGINEECILFGYLNEWETDDFPSNILEGENE